MPRWFAVLLRLLGGALAALLAGGMALFALAGALGGDETIIGLWFLVAVPGAVVLTLVMALGLAAAKDRAAFDRISLAVGALVLVGAGALAWANLPPAATLSRAAYWIVVGAGPPLAQVATLWLVLKGLSGRPGP